MKKIANYLTFSRIILSIILLTFFNEVNVTFLIIFAIAELTDMVDGTIARKTNSVSLTGSLLDTIADILLASNIFKIVLNVNALQGNLLIWFIVIVIIALLAPLISRIKFKETYFVHSISSKILGGVICLIPLDVYFDGIGRYLIFCLIIFSFSMIENLLIVIISKRPDSDSKSLFHTFRSNKQLKSGED